MFRIAAGLLVTLASIGLRQTPPPVHASSPCTTGITLTLHPGLPPLTNRTPHPMARDIPRGPFKVSLPVYPGLKRLSHFAANPLLGYPLDPYLQTGAVEYEGTGDPAGVMRWARKAYAACGWRPDGSTTAGSGLLGLDFVSTRNRHLQAEVSSAGFYIAYAALELTYPPRPASSYLRGRFREVRIAFQFNNYSRPMPTHRVVHVTVTSQAAIARLVAAINSLTDPWTDSLRTAGGGGNGPAWLSFVRPDGRRLHAYEPGQGALSVNGSRMLLDPGQVWHTITWLVRGAT